MVKLGGYLIADGDLSMYFIGFDPGFEVKLSKNMTAQLSMSFTYDNGDGVYSSNKKNIYSLQSRYYLNGKNWKKSPFIGVVAQKLRTHYQQYADEFGAFPAHYLYKERKANKRALGVIIGYNLKIYKQVGLDFHVGAVGQHGNEYALFRKHSTSAAITTLKNNVVNVRPFWGINLFIAID